MIIHPSFGPIRRRIVLVGRSGTGKSALRAALVDALSHNGSPPTRVVELKLAAPLYRLQAMTYAEAGVTLGPEAQDQELLTFLARKLRSISADALIRPFTAALRAVGDGDMVINDDLRDPFVDAPALRDLQFFFLRVHCDEAVRQQRLRVRADLTSADDRALNAGLEAIHCHVVVDSTSTPTAGLVSQVLDAVRVSSTS